MLVEVLSNLLLSGKDSIARHITTCSLGMTTFLFTGTPGIEEVHPICLMVEGGLCSSMAGRRMFL